MAPRPNILFIMTDQQQAAPLAPDHPCAMPHSRALAANGVNFSRAYTPCPLCVPARMSLMTGVYPHTHGLIDNSNLPGGIVLAQRNKGVRDVFAHRPLSELPCFSQHLQESGYRLKWSGRWHVFPGHHPEEIGFESFDWTERDYQAYRSSLGLTTGLYSPERIHQGRCVCRSGFNPFPLYGKTLEPVEAELDYYTTELALGRLDELGATDAPWFLGVGFVGPHDPYVVPEPYASMYDPDSVVLPDNFADTMEDKPGLYRKQRALVWGDLTEREYREMIACYWGFNTFVDDQIGKLVARVQALGQLENTLIILTSDHGENMGAHGLVYKSLSMFEETLRIPYIAHWPGGIADPGQTSEALVSLLDLAPTFLDLAGAEPLPDMHGQSLAPLLAGEAPSDWRDTLTAESAGAGNHVTQRICWQGRWKFVYNGFDFDELYDLEADPGEMHNLARDPAYRAQLEELARASWREHARTGDYLVNLLQPHTNLMPVGPVAHERLS